MCRGEDAHRTVPSSQDKGICWHAFRGRDPYAFGFKVFADRLDLGTWAEVAIGADYPEPTWTDRAENRHHVTLVSRLEDNVMSGMRDLQVSRADGPFELVERDIPQPAVRQVRIKVQACGVCSQRFDHQGRSRSRRAVSTCAWPRSRRDRRRGRRRRAHLEDGPEGWRRVVRWSFVVPAAGDAHCCAHSRDQLIPLA